MTEITYSRVGDYLYPNLYIDKPQPSYGKYGMLRKQFLKEHRPGTYSGLMLTCELNLHLAEVDWLARDCVSRLVSDLAKQQGIDEALKARNQMAWVGAMNAIKAQAEEVALAAYVYC